MSNVTLILTKVCQHLKMRPHKVHVEGKEEILMYSSIECKGIIGNDSRHYVLDLLRMFPPDLNYLPNEEVELGEASATLGFPKQFRHRLCCLRQELVESYVDEKYVQFVKFAAKEIQQMNKEKIEKVQRAEAAEKEAAEEAKKEIENGEVGGLEGEQPVVNGVLPEDSSSQVTRSFKYYFI